MDKLIYLVPAMGLLGLLYTWMKFIWVGKQDAGNDRMRETSTYIAEGAMAFFPVRRADPMPLPPPARAALLAALLASPDAAQAPALRVPVTVDTLPNGLTVIVHEDHSVPTVAVNLWYHVGSGDEKAGRTGFAHLFEHLMFMGSQNAEDPAFDRLLEGAGANNNGSTTEDRTNYYEWGPATALPLMLWLEADRMGWLLPTMTGEKVDLQRDVVKNERRQGPSLGC